MKGGVEIAAPAKINLVLRVLHRRPDGFHELDTLFQAVDLADTLRLEATTGPGVRLRVRGADLGPPDENLVARAARRFLEVSGVPGGVDISLVKRIPAGAGLGGGSSDAAATLRGLEALTGARLEPNGLRRIAEELGSDVPFFLGPGTHARGRGRGDRLTFLPALPPAAVVLGLPAVHVPTAQAYALLGRGLADEAAGAPPPPSRPAEPGGWPGIAAVAVNDFEDVVCRAYPEVARALAAVRAGEPLLAMLSGSGGAVFAVHRVRAAAARARESAARTDPHTRYVIVDTLAEHPGVTPAKA